MHISKILKRIESGAYNDSNDFNFLHGLSLNIKYPKRPIFSPFIAHPKLMKRIAIFPLVFFYDYFPKGMAIYSNINVRPFRRILNFGNTCKHCGRKGNWLCIEQDFTFIDNNVNSWCIHSYSDPNDHYSMMTIDHIQPKAKNGKNSIKNYQVLCYSCNQYKADSTSDEEMLINMNSKR